MDFVPPVAQELRKFFDDSMVSHLKGWLPVAMPSGLFCSFFRFLWSVGLAVALSGPAAAAGMLYKICVPGAEGPSYLFGTLHSEDPRVLALPPVVVDAFARSHSFAMEAVPDAEAIMESMLVMTYTDGRTLREVLPRALYREATAALAERGLPVGAYRDFKPWAVVTLLSVPPSETGRFLDIRLYESAMASGKRVEGLESMEEQLQIFDGLDEADQIALLRETLASRGRLPGLFESMTLGYLARDLDALVVASDRYLEGVEPRVAQLLMDAAVGSRNRRMVERMIPLLNEGGWFIAVGALHLPQQDGILRLLAERGYLVETVF